MSESLQMRSRLLTCRVAEQWLALPVEQLSEVVTAQMKTVIPLAPEAVNGLINLRGKILTELDMRKILHIDPDQNQNDYRTIIIESDGIENFGLTVDAVGEVIDMDTDAFERTPESLGTNWKKICHGVLKQEKRILILLDVEKIIQMSMPVTES
ncbi:purine-binding chemotaxis protein CheW [Mariprofundus micogutta]|uniref:Purine-binding chemotaxis protein CheW n=1 Tax=Mariprofundus micogutta TaxID=1921010 RepID=A0A1L8CNN2_9PROT|nr:chemotaxis protein CheW [Mariprofundus micogutta]GAV20532.1 purine-binding chemotaxis protein CheW [Mariprofundus micogutta]